MRLIVAIGVIVSVIAGGTVAVVLANSHGTKPAMSHPASSRSSPPPTTVPEAIMQTHADSNGVVDFEGALELFSYAFTPLPGVSLPPGAPGDPGEWADLAVTLAVSHLDEMTAAQRQVVLPFITDAGPGTTTPSVSRAVGPVLESARTLADQGTFVHSDILGLIDIAVAAEGQKLGHTLNDSPALADLLHVHLILAQKDLTPSGVVAPAWTFCTHGPDVDANGNFLPTINTTGKITDCYIFAGPSVWASQDANGHWVKSTLTVAEMYHEVFHCFQFFVVGSVSGTVAYTAPAWVIEGGADWAAASILPFDEPAWTDYLKSPGTPLSQRSYDAFGLFFEIEYLGRPLWPQWWGIWSQAAEGGWGTSDWFDGIAGDHRTALLDAWGASWYRNASIGHDWSVTGNGQLADNPRPAAPAKFDGPLSITSPPFATVQVDIPAQQKGTLVVAVAQGTASFRVIDSAGHERVDADLIALCWGTCGSCPGTSANPPVFLVTGLVHWALTSQESFGVAGLRVMELSAYCNWKPILPPALQGCLQQCPGSNGDPHLRTATEQRYTFQAAGEFVLLRSPDDSVEVQAREEPYAQQGTTFTVNTAVAARVGSHRVSVYAAGGAQALQVHVDGQTVPLTSTMNLSGGGRVLPDSAGVEIDLPDGSVLWALHTSGIYGINVEIAPSDALRTDGVGLLGAITLGYSLPMLPDGSGMHISANLVAQYQYKYTTFASAWQVDQTTSLFDYDAGKSAASYDVPGFVPEGGPPKPLDPNARAAAETQCAGVEDVDLRNDCVYDVTVTGNTGFVGAYTASGAFLTPTGSPDSGGPLPGPPSPSASPSPSPVPSSATLKELIPDIDHLNGYVIGPDGAVDILITSQNHTQDLIAVDPATSTVRNRATVSSASLGYGGLASASGSLWLMISTGPSTCAVAQVDPTSLAVQNTMPLALCPYLGVSLIVAAAGQVWVYDGNGHIERIDMSTKSISETIPLPANDQGIEGTLLASTTTIFWSDYLGVWRVDPAASALVQIDNLDTAFPAGDGVWVQTYAGAVGFCDSDACLSGQPDTTLNVGRNIIGADDHNVYIEDPTTMGILDYPTDGSPGGALGTSTVDSTGAPLLIGSHNAYRVFTRAPASGEPFPLYFENFPLP